jgi:hypothetical protein
VIGINETWLDLQSRNLVAEIMLPGYKMFNVDKPTPSKRGGGSILYIKETLHPVLKTVHATVSCEILSAEIKVVRATIKLALVYRNSHTLAEHDAQLYETLEEIVSSSHETIIFGDFNLPYIDWVSLTSLAPGNKLTDFVKDNNMVQLVREPTRGNNMLDLVMSTEERLISNILVGNKLGGADHNMVEFTIKTSRQAPYGIIRRPNFARADFQGLRNQLCAPNLLEQIREATADNCCRILKERVREACDRFIPMRTIDLKRKIQPPWWNVEVGRALRQRNALHAQSLRDNTREARDLHRLACRAATRAVRSSKRTKEKSIADNAKTNPKEFYSYVNERRIARDSIGPLVDAGGVLRTSPEDMTSVLNNLFCSVFTVEGPGYEQETVFVGEVTLNNVVFTREEVVEQLEGLNIYKSLGPDGLHPRVLKETREQLADSLAHVFNLSMASGEVPDDWRMANVTAIFKKGDRQSPSNYRPISLTSVVCKTIERLIREHLVNHLEDNGLIHDTQHGFRRKRSCLTNLLDFFNNVINVYDHCKAVDVIYLDFQKAFDKVPHRRLLHKVSELGIGGNVLRWLRAWLTGRKQRVCIGQAMSEWAPVTSGVPQGSVLGPVLFLIYVNDMDAGLLCKVSKFADDTKLCHAALREQDRLAIQHDLEKLIEWSEVWQMPFNVAKCTVMHMGCHNANFNYTMAGDNLAAVNQQKDLGILISDDLKWNAQVQNSYNAAIKQLGFIARNFTYKSKDIVLPLYKSIIRPHLEYAVQFWSPHMRGDIAKLERVQHRATKLIPQLRHLSYEDRLKELGLTTLEQRRLRGQLIETFKYLKGFNNVSPVGLFDRDYNVRTRNNGAKLVGKRFATTIAEHFFPIAISRIWNNLPAAVVAAESVNAFKNRLDKHWE